MFKSQFEIVNKDINHIQFTHLKICDDEFNRYIIESIFNDNSLYKYVTNFFENDLEDCGKIYPIKQLINLIKNVKKEYIDTFLPIELKKELCKRIKPRYNGSIIDIGSTTWEEEFSKYLELKITGYDVVAEIILSKIIEEELGADILVTKLAETTNNNMKVFGIDTVHYSENSNTLFLGESKLTNDIDLGLKEHYEETMLMDYKISQECQLLVQRKNDFRCKTKTKKSIIKFGKKMVEENVLSIMSMKEEDMTFKISIVYFIAHGEEFDYDFITEKINNFRKKINFSNINRIYCITLPIRNKKDFINKIKEVIDKYE